MRRVTRRCECGRGWSWTVSVAANDPPPGGTHLAENEAVGGVAWMAVDGEETGQCPASDPPEVRAPQGTRSFPGRHAQEVPRRNRGEAIGQRSRLGQNVERRVGGQRVRAERGEDARGTHGQE